jgi:hypothetical protein
MAVTVTHPFVSAISDGADATVVRPSNWNATHSLTGTVDVANGGTGASTASITSFNNITGYTAAGATGTTSTNLVFSASPTFTGTLGAAAITASTTLGVTGVSTLTGGATVNGPLIIGWNTSATYPTSGGYGVLGWNFSGGSAEVNSWNAYIGAVVSFNWKQKTGTSAATDLMQLSPTGVLTTTSSVIALGGISGGTF